MNLSKLTNESLVVLNGSDTTKDAVIRTLIKKLYQQGKISSEQEFYDAVIAREGVSATGIDAGLAIPHGKSEAVKEASFAVMTVESPIADWESVMPTNEVKYIFLLAIPAVDEDGTQMKMLSEMMTKMSNPDYTNVLYGSATVKDFIENLDGPKTKEEVEVKTFDRSIVAVTACAAGIAHTYMAAEALVKAGQEMGVSVYVEKQGANGIEDRHTNEMLKNATAAIFSVDVAVKQEERFAHLPTEKTRVAAPLKEAKAIIQRALDKAENFTAGEFVEVDEKPKSIGEEIKESVLTGISHIVPIIVAAGMLGAFIVIYRNFMGLGDPEVWGALDPSHWLKMFDGFRGQLFTMMVPILSAYMAYSIAEKPALAAGFAAGIGANIVNGGFLVGMLGGLFAGYAVRYIKKVIPAKGTFAGFVSFVIYPVVSVTLTGAVVLFIIGEPVAYLNSVMFDFLASLQGGNAAILGAFIGIMVSFDLGGPVNKAAYTFCVAALGDGVLMPYCVFASVKMVSAFAVTFATKFKKDIFTEQEREVGNSTWLLGLAGITEGAIPFMMADPLRVMLSLCAGSAVTGAIVAAYGIGLDVPGAGIFSALVLTTDNLAMGAAVWFFAAVLGALISAAILVVTRQQKLKKAK